MGTSRTKGGETAEDSPCSEVEGSAVGASKVGAPRSRRRWIALALAGLWFAFTSLAIVRVPSSTLWLPTLVASSWGHLWFGIGIALVAIAIVRSLRRERSRLALATVLLLAGAVLAAATPLARQRVVAGSLPGRLESSFGGGGDPPVLPAPLDLSAVERTTHVFVERDSGPLRLDLFRAPFEAGATARPVLLVVHGGSWQRGERSDFPRLNEHLAARGVAVVDLDYRLAPTHRFPAPIEDIEAALDFVSAHAVEYGLDPGRVALLGRSAGGHLALTAAYTFPERVRGVVAFYAPTDLPYSWKTSIDTTYVDGKALIEALMGGRPDEEPDLYRAASPRTIATERSPPTLLLHGDRDRLVSPLQSIRLAERLAELEVAHLHVEIPGATHGFDAAFGGTAGRISTRAIERFLGVVLFSSGAEGWTR